MGIFRTFRTVSGDEESVFMVLPNYLSPPVPTLRFFVSDHPPLLLGNFYRGGLQSPQRDSLQRFRIFPILGKPD